MGTISANRIEEALSKAKGVGTVEDKFTIMGCSVTLQSLLPSEYEAINQETSELEDLAYLNAFRVGHLCRSIVEINGLNLRNVDYIQVDVEDPRTNEIRPVRVERHAYLRDYVLSTWKKEAIDVGMRKFSELVEKAEKAASEGVEFVNPDEQSDEKLKRLMGEVQELLTEVPREIAARILDESGLIFKSTKDELEATHQALSKISKPSEPVSTPIRPKLSETLPEPSSQPAQATQSTRAPSESLRPLTPEEIMKSRTPLTAQTDLPQTVPQYPPMAAPPPGKVVTSQTSKSQMYADIEAEAEKDLQQTPVVMKQSASAPPVAYSLQDGVPEVVSTQVSVDPRVVGVFDSPPRGGINARWKKPSTP